MQKIGKKRYADIVLILCLLIAALSVFIIWRITRAPGKWAVVYIDTVKTERYPLDIDGEYTLNGGTNILVISEGQAYMKFADCPDKKCVHSGKKSLAGEWIYCMPNGVEVRIEGGEDEIIVGRGELTPCSPFLRFSYSLPGYGFDTEGLS